MARIASRAWPRRAGSSGTARSAATRPPTLGPARFGAGLGRRLRVRPGRRHDPEWSSLSPAVMVMPELALARRGDEARLTVTAVLDGRRVGGGGGRAAARAGGVARAGRHAAARPGPRRRPRAWRRRRRPSTSSRRSARGVERIRAGELDKVVLAREVRVHAPAAIDPAPVFDALRAGFPACYCYLVGTPGAGLRRRQPGAAGAPRRAPAPRPSRSPAPPAAAPTRRLTTTLGEQLLHVGRRTARSRRSSSRRIERTLRPVSVWVAAADEPVLVKVQNVQHLATPIRAQLAEPVSCVELAGRLHPTPAVGGEPREKALPLIPALEGLDRGWYAGTGGLDRPVRGRRVLRGPALRAAARPGGAPLRGRAGSCATRCRRTSSRRTRSSSRRCCRC